jgi:integrase
MGRPKGNYVRIGKVNDIRQRPSVAKHSSRKVDTKRKPWEVRWYVGTAQRQERFRYKQEAVSFHAALEQAVLRQETFNTSTGRPLSWEVQNPTFCDWAKQYVSRNSPHWAQKTIRSNVDSITMGVVAFRRADAPNVSDEDRVELRKWLKGSVDACPDSVARWSLRLSDCTKSICGSVRAAVRLNLAGEPLAASTAQRNTTQIGAVFNEAVDDGLIATSPWDRERRNKKKTKSESHRPLTPKDIPSFSVAADLVSKVADSGARLILKMILLLGLRPGEARAARIEHLILPDSGWGVLRIHTAAGGMTPKQSAELEDPKTGYRRVPVPESLAEDLRKYIGNRTEGFIVLGKKGGLLNEAVPADAWRSVCSNSDWVPYSLRHTAATTWLTKGGNPAEIARRLGNSVEVLMSTYVNFIEGDDDRLNSILQASIDQAN